MTTPASAMGSPVHEFFPYLRVNNATAAIEFYARAFGAREKFRLTEPSGRIGHAELWFGASLVMLSDEYPEYGISAPQNGGTGCAIHLHVDNADAMAAQAVAAGATMLRPLTDSFHGERGCALRDPFGHEWMLGHTIEVVSPEEMQRRFTAMFG